jgi:arginase
LQIQLIAVPYDAGLRDMRMGRGPAHLLELGAEAVLRERGDEVSCLTLDSRVPFPTEIGVAVDLNRQVSECVRATLDRGLFPLLLAGNCNVSIGAVAALDLPAVMWFDAHADFNTPDTTVTGFFDGMSLGAMTGQSWRTLTRTIPGFMPVPENQVVLIGARDIDDEEADLLRASEVVVLTASTVQRLSILDALAPVLRALHARTQRVFLHIDLDVLDPSEGTVNPFAAPHGLALKHVLAAIRRIGEQFTVIGATVSAYDPAVDTDDRAGMAALKIIGEIAAAAKR